MFAAPVLGVCSWSLQPASPDELLEKLAQTGLSALQLALKPFHGGGLLGARGWPLAATASRLADQGVVLRSAMFATRGEDYTSLASIRETGGLRADAHWRANARLAREDAARCAELGLSLVSFHAGFLPHEPDDPLRVVMLERLAEVVGSFAEQGVSVAFETGQESAATLLGVLEQLDCPTAGVNFDPANMLLYGMGDPVAALNALLPWVRQLHVKDARPAVRPGEWGLEVAVGEGEVDWDGIFAALARAPRTIDLMIEREAGEQRVADVRQAIEHVAPRLAALREARP
ncbi:MAG: sugar phosphate isomerase/epimerase [Planctomycetota bacterium]|nr:MAG: sugar phosphate isomerase/epimerase [Planctomycetota bacterium]